MKGYKEIKAFDLKENIFNLFEKDWMLLTAGNEGHFNTMTISWGTMGILWSMPVVFCFVRPQRYTDQFITCEPYFSLSTLPNNMREAYNICGSKSGKDCNKVKDAGLHSLITPNGSIAFEEARLIIECKKIYADKLNENSIIDSSIPEKFYPNADFHNMYMGQITGIFEKL